MKVMTVYFQYGALMHGMDKVFDAFDKTGIMHRTTPHTQMLEIAQEFQPQITICFHPFLRDFQPIGQEIDKLGGHKILWSMEEPYEIDLVLENHHHFGYVLTQDKTSAQELQKLIGKGTHIPHGCNPDVHKSVTVDYEYRSDLCFIGNGFPSRLNFFRRVLPELKNYQVLLGGMGWRALNAVKGQKIINTGVGERAYRDYLNGAKICLNLHRLENDVPSANSRRIQPSSPNNRFFEIASCGKPQIVDNTRDPEIWEYFGKDELIVFNDETDFLEKFKYLMEHPQIRLEMGQKAQKRAWADHSYEKRIAWILGNLIQDGRG